MIIERSSDRKELKRHNAPMISRLPTQFEVERAAAMHVPLQVAVIMEEDDEERNPVTIPFRVLVGSLMHICNTVRPDIAFAVSYLARFMRSYTQAHWKAAKHVLKY
ncbi:Retrovirus-related Pol polyprotein from transposon TNT 1-94 [Gracilariopsis chorda]|uniref:Retrovirus-related Pol polyprotein from transposon TNT 1-94 n=1 Tax=Gracilariopsis chorda TaxID=448386 RepID=A0A2V3IV12_9FLOR|nr:Retrovirus-related Pol polyprotein from transposon TNT 1-94 [Gracilariopsis chorda]|eukprot:PXF45962.1 Retrovirus-related Pol polyprotein from transposon TNT 1-94 [Gracilariopsis chorda]